MKLAYISPESSVPYIAVILTISDLSKILKVYHRVRKQNNINGNSKTLRQHLLYVQDRIKRLCRPNSLKLHHPKIINKVELQKSRDIFTNKNENLVNPIIHAVQFKNLWIKEDFNDNDNESKKDNDYIITIRYRNVIKSDSNDLFDKMLLEGSARNLEFQVEVINQEIINNIHSKPINNLYSIIKLLSLLTKYP